MRVFGIGMPKTGVTSLWQALLMLGYMAIQAKTLHDVFCHEAATDGMVTCHYKILDKMFPGSKFVLTVRPMDMWLRSCEAHFSRGTDDLHYRYTRMRLFGRMDYDEKCFLKAGRRHVDDVLSYFQKRPNDLLLYHTGKDGWEPLCRFLDRPMPGKRFPHLNKTRYEHVTL